MRQHKHLPSSDYHRHHHHHDGYHHHHHHSRSSVSVPRGAYYVSSRSHSRGPATPSPRVSVTSTTYRRSAPVVYAERTTYR